MATYRALYTDYPWANAELEREILADVDCELVESTDNREQTLADLAPNIDVVLTCWAPVTRQVIEAGESIRHIARTGIGLDNIDVGCATERRIVVTNVPDYCIEEVAEHSLALMFALVRNLGRYQLATKRGEYDLVGGLPVECLKGKTLGLVGVGRIGSRVAELVQPLGMSVVAFNRSEKTPPGVTWSPWEDLLRMSDFVSLHLPLTPQTDKLISDSALAQMKPTAYLINTSRGGLVDHAALAGALQDGRLAGAGLDVQDPEPPDLASPPWSDPRVIVTPHVAFHSTEAVEQLRTRVARQVVDFLEGRRPENIVNAQALGM
ncbi:C-terminal binding protein [Pirellulales bacterium]|nr:C-terminal binding protein [Pirellulales bacterium]